LGWFAWETLTLRRLVTPVAEQTPIPQSVNLPGAAGGVLGGLFAKKKEPAAKKPKFVRSTKPKTDVVPAPAVDEGEVKLEEQPTIPPIAEIIAESSIELSAESARAPNLTIPDSSAPATEEIPVSSVETPASETSPTPAELASSFTPLPLPLEISEIGSEASVEPAEAQPEPQQQPEADDFDEETEWRKAVKESQAAAAAAPTPAKPAKKSGGFASLFGNIKNSLGGMLGRGGDKNKSDATPQTPKPSTTPESIAPESKITAMPAPAIDQILESELASAAAEVAAETSNTAVETSPGVPFPSDVEAMAELIAAETATSEKIGETAIDSPSSAQTQTPPPAVGEPEAEAPAASIEMTVVEMVSVAPEMEASGEPDLSPQVEVVSVAVMSIESTDRKPSSEGEQPELIRPNPPPPDLVETAKPAAQSKSENVAGEDKPSS